jgi:2-polyprenyl-3-methyl-5-hydroxy-6-metoxy-1,4-benzoquinol methylase
MEKRTECNICSGTSFTTVYKYKTHGVLRCNRCKTLCRDIVFNREESERLYSEDYFCDLQKDFFHSNRELRERAFRNKIEIIDKLYPSKGRLLDLGCAIGTFLKVAREDSWEVEGIELSKYAANYAVEKENLTVHNGDLLDMKLPSNSFDVVTLWDMVDHSETPNDVIKEVYRILKPGGIAAMDTFMDDALLFAMANYMYKFSFGMIKGPSFKAHPIHHSHYFSTETFKSLLESNGFEVIFRKGSYLEGSVTSVGTIGKVVVSIFNTMSRFIGREMELCIVGKKGE